MNADPESPTPKPVVPSGPLHGGACRYPVEIGWVQSARRGIFAIAAIALTALVTIGIALGSSCRMAGAQEARLNALDITTATQDQTISAVDERQSVRYEKLLELTIRIDGRLQALTEKLTAESELARDKQR